MIEDSLHGITAARAAGMRCLAVATYYSPDRLVGRIGWCGRWKRWIRAIWRRSLRKSGRRITGARARHTWVRRARPFGLLNLEQLDLEDEGSLRRNHRGWPCSP